MLRQSTSTTTLPRDQCRTDTQVELSVCKASCERLIYMRILRRGNGTNKEGRSGLSKDNCIANCTMQLPCVTLKQAVHRELPWSPRAVLTRLQTALHVDAPLSMQHYLRFVRSCLFRHKWHNKIEVYGQLLLVLVQHQYKSVLDHDLIIQYEVAITSPSHNY